MKRSRPRKKAGPAERAAPIERGDDQSLRQGLGRLGIQATPERLEAFALYRSELLRWSLRVNVTGFRTPEAIVREGFLRSLSYRAGFDPRPGLRAVDIGSGAGFPGLVLKIGYPEIDMLLVEATRVRATFLRFLIRQLALTGVRCIHARAEQLQGDPDHRAAYQVAFARGVGPLAQVAALAEPLLVPGGRLVLQVGQKMADSLGPIRPRLAALGLQTVACDTFALGLPIQPTRLLAIEKTQ